MFETEPSCIFVASIAAAAFIFASSIFVILFPVPSASNVLFVNVVVLLPVTKDVTPDNKFNSVAVAVTATFSLIFGLVKVLFVSVCVPANVVTVLSIEIVKLSVEVTEVSIPVPPNAFNVSPEPIDSEPLSPASVNEPAAPASNFLVELL